MGVVRTRSPILVLGIGNILLCDEGIGVHVIKALEEVDLPDDVELLDGGTAGVDLLDFISDRRKVIFVDALDADVTAGTILRIEAEDLAVNTQQSISLHEFGITEMLMTAKQLGCAPPQAVIIGVKPKDITCGLELSKELSDALPGIVEFCLAEINNSRQDAAS